MTSADLEDLDETQVTHYLRVLPSALELQADRNAVSLAAIIAKMMM